MLAATFLILCLPLTFNVHGQETATPAKITFTVDLSLDSYQPAIIINKLTQAFAISDIEFTALRVPSNRSLNLAHMGVVDGELSRVGNLHEVTNNKYSNLIKIDHKMLSVWVSVFGIHDNIRIHSLEDIGQYSVCYINGRKFFDDVFAPLVKPGSLMRVNSDRQAFEALAKKRVDIVITTHVEGQQLIASEPKFSQIKQIKKIIELPIYSYIHKKHQALLPELLENLAQVDSKSEGD